MIYRKPAARVTRYCPTVASIVAAGALVALILFNVTADARAYRGGGYRGGGLHGATLVHVGGYRGGYRGYRNGGYRRYPYGYRRYGYRAAALGAYGAGYYGACGTYPYYDRHTGVCRRTGGTGTMARGVSTASASIEDTGAAIVWGTMAPTVAAFTGEGRWRCEAATGAGGDKSRRK
jgi:hypothetical protein